MDLPQEFCWTRVGTEAGEGIQGILNRKEIERIRSGGVFTWGIGNAVGPSLAQLLLLTRSPTVVFSPIHSKPRIQDEKPESRVLWTAGVTLDGKRWKLPESSFVTSGVQTSKRAKSHYALICSSRKKLRLEVERQTFPLDSVSNFVSGKPVGASQVTAVVRYDAHRPYIRGTEYPIAMVAKLVYPFFVKLIEPIKLPENCSVDQYETRLQLMRSLRPHISR